LAALLGVYLHFPWCRKRCPYCDFAVEVGEPPHDAYRDAILRELDARAPRFSGRLVSIYFGGGTPSLWRPDCIATVIAAVRSRWDHGELEVTIEANPTDVTPDRLAAWRDAHINRISIGVQSLAPDELVALGRDHRFGDGTAAIERALQAGGFAVSADFILGTPPRKRPAWIAPVVATAVDHLSVYELTIEDRTAFGHRVRTGSLVPLDEDALAELYVTTHDALVAAGFEHYEVSSFARLGKRAIHNALYWRGEPFLGLGTGAASLELLADGSGSRATNPRRAAAYLAAPGVPAEVMAVGVREMAVDRAWLGMRTSDGVERTLIPPRIADRLVADRLAVVRGERICPTLRGFLMADRIASSIVQAWGDDADRGL
jgi:oxygen-independent coproporphyrinogen-3 oxidase